MQTTFRSQIYRKNVLQSRGRRQVVAFRESIIIFGGNNPNSKRTTDGVTRS